MQSAQTPQRRASIPEIIGAWLHIWTPPRDARVPEIPWRKLAIGTGIGLVVLGIALAIMIPRIDNHKEQTAKANAAYKAAAVARNRARINKSQAAKHGEARTLRPEAGSGPGLLALAKVKLLTAVEADIFADAKARAAAGEMKPVTGPTTCEHVAGTPTSGDVGVFDCFVVTHRIDPTKHSASGAIGYPFRAVLNYKDFTYSWCKTEQVPGEMLVLNPKDVTLLPPACRGPKAR
jgi:type II secretory pathway pseudopilin PulG